MYQNNMLFVKTWLATEPLNMCSVCSSFVWCFGINWYRWKDRRSPVWTFCFSV